MEFRPLHNSSELLLACNSFYVQARLSRHWALEFGMGIPVVSLSIYPWTVGSCRVVPELALSTS